MKTLTSKTTHNTHTFEIVETFPRGYEVWNIGRKNFNFECYIPLAKPKPTRYAFQKCIDVETLKAIKVTDEETALKILNLSSYGVVDKGQFERLNKYWVGMGKCLKNRREL